MTAVIFDCDGVLVDSEVIAVRAELHALKELGLPYDEDEYVHRHLGATVEAFLSALAEEHMTCHGSPLPDGFTEQLLQDTKNEMDSSLESLPGVHAVLDAIRYPRAVASSSGISRLHSKLLMTDLYHLFEPHIYSVDQVKRGKPAPDLFIYAAKQLGFAPDQCIAIEDSVNGVKSARAAGMNVIGFVGGGHCRPSHSGYLSNAGATIIVDHMDQILEALDALISAS